MDKTGDPEDRLDKFLAALPGSNSRFALYDYEYYADSNKQRKASKLLFIQWIPENANDRDRVTYTQAQSVFKPKLSGIFVHSIVNKSDLRTIVVDEA